MHCIWRRRTLQIDKKDNICSTTLIQIPESFISVSLTFAHIAFNLHATKSSPSQNSDYVQLKLTLGFSVIVVEVLFPLCGGELTHISNKQIFIVAIAEPVWTEETCA